MPRIVCPRCGLSLSRQKYEGVDVDMCQECWGVWLDKGELEQVIESKQYKFRPEEKAAFKGLIEGIRPDPKNESSAPCPHCKKDMARIRYASTTSIWVDRCAEHGIWLDNKEIKAIQAYHEVKGGSLGPDSLLGALGNAANE